MLRANIINSERSEHHYIARQYQRVLAGVHELAEVYVVDEDRREGRNEKYPLNPRTTNKEGDCQK